MQAESFSVFLNTANELVDRLSADKSPTARELSREALQLADTFRAWELSPPEPHDRASAVRALLDLQRRAMEYLSASPTSSPQVPSR